MTTPRRKRKIIGEEFIRVFEEEAAKLEDARYLVQGTLYSDVIESGGSDGAATIKSHHNVGGLPEDLEFELVEPLRMLFKDEVRAVGAELGLPERLVWRQPFPGPGLAIRIVGGEVNKERLDILRAADAILQEEIRAAGLYRQLWQSFCVLPVVRSVGVQGDGRTYAYPIVIRAVTSDDAMTADWARLPYDLLERVSNRIINEVRGVNRVALDISSKPPGDDRVGVGPGSSGDLAVHSAVTRHSTADAPVLALDIDPRPRPGRARGAAARAAAAAAGRAGDLRSRWWALVPALSIVVVIVAVNFYEGSATFLTYLALVAVPPLAALALGLLVRGARPALALAAVPLFALAWALPGALAGEAAATALSGLACVALGWMLVSVVPARWLRLGVYAMAAIDAWLVAGDLLQGPNSVLSVASPAADLPRLQAVHFGSGADGLRRPLRRRPRRLPPRLRPASPAARRAALVAVLALLFDLLFFAVDTLPATVPVAVALALMQRAENRSAAQRRGRRGDRQLSCRRPTSSGREAGRPGCRPRTSRARPRSRSGGGRRWRRRCRRRSRSAGRCGPFRPSFSGEGSARCTYMKS